MCIFLFIRPESAETSEFTVECGDVILVATDGVFDNVPEPVLVAEMRRAQGLAGETKKLQAVANSIAWMARNLSFDGCYMSPFAKSARQNGIDAIGKMFFRLLIRITKLRGFWFRDQSQRRLANCII